MSCVICLGAPNCPVCKEAPTTETCQECNGEGALYFNVDGIEVTKEAIINAPENTIRETCSNCLGNGEIITEEEYKLYA